MRKKLEILAAAVVCGLGVAFWLRLTVAGPRVVTRWNQDLYAIYYPAYSFAYRSARFLPRWNPHQLAGVPFLAAYNGGYLYPPNFLATVLPVRLAIGWLCAGHLVLAGLLGFLCARAFGLSSPSATLAGAAYMLSGYFVLETIHPSYLAATAWIPGIFLGAARVVTAPGPSAAMLLGVAVALQLLAGGPHILCYTLYALAVAGIVLLLLHPDARDPSRIGRVVGSLGLGIAIAALLSAVQVLPTLDLVARAARSFHGLTVEQTLPQRPSVAALELAIFMPGLIAFLAVVGLAERRRRPVVAALLALVVFAGLVGLGTPVYTRFFYHLPGVKLFRLPQAMLNAGTLALALLAGIGLDVLHGARENRRVGLTLGCLAVSVPLLLVTPLPARRHAYALLAAAAAVALLPRPWLRTASVWVVVAVVVGDRLAPPGSRSMMPQDNPPEFFAPPPAVRFLQEHAGFDRVLVIRNWQKRFPFMEKLGTLYGLDVVQDYEPLAPAAYQRFLAPFEAVNVDRPLFWGRFYPSPFMPGWPALDMLATRFVIVPTGVRWPGELTSRFRVVYDGPDARVYENLRSLPRAYVVSDLRVVPDADEALARVEAPNFDPRRTAIVDRPADLGPGTVPDSVPGPVQLERVDDEEVSLRVAPARPALLVLADLYWPGWHVAVDGVERPLYRVDYLFRGVALAPGDHRVRFWYAPRLLEVGACITGTTIVVIGIIAARRRRPTSRACTVPGAHVGSGP
ncbi:MAG TPA: YfhO family protein [Candidatus Binatia bacterium]|nr:YfhO family protein [Candidatus Binatia bacterium]